MPLSQPPANGRGSKGGESCGVVLQGITTVPRQPRLREVKGLAEDIARQAWYSQDKTAWPDSVKHGLSHPQLLASLVTCRQWAHGHIGDGRSPCHSCHSVQI